MKIKTNEKYKTIKTLTSMKPKSEVFYTFLPYNLLVNKLHYRLIIVPLYSRDWS